MQTISNYRFSPADLHITERKPGISAFARVRNGAEFLAPTIASHIDFFDEVVIVINQCEDDTEAVVGKLLRRYPEKVRAVHYLDRVMPLGHPAYADMPYDSPTSMGNYSNFALSQTRYTIATKLDDDHIAIARNLKPIIETIRQRQFRLGDTMMCVAGLNLVHGKQGIGVLRSEPFNGAGDHGYFEVSERTIFQHNRKHETFTHKTLNRVHCGLTFLHCKYLKAGEGFRNYEIESNPDSRFARKRRRFEKEREAETLSELAQQARWHSVPRALELFLPEKIRLASARWRTLKRDSAGLDLQATLGEARRRIEA